MKVRLSGFRQWYVFTTAVLFVALLATTGEVNGQTLQVPAEAGANVLADSEGAIAAILLHYDPGLSSELAPVYEDLFRVLPTGVQVTVICPSASAAEDFSDTWGTATEHWAVDVVNVGFPISIWARDRYIARQQEQSSQEVSSFVPAGNDSYEPEKRNDLLALELLTEAQLLPRTLDTHLHLEGGNVVSNLRHVFVGANVLNENIAIGRSAVANELSTVFGRTYIPVAGKDGDVPWCHVDMYLTPVSDDTVLIANPRMAELILTRYSDDDSDDVVAGFNACESDTTQDRLDDIASLALNRGYKVIRLPALVNSSEGWMITYNNVLMDHRGGRRTLYMPTYDIPDLDRAAAAIYLGLGFDVETIDVSRVYTRGGALRCIVNVTERSGSGPSQGSTAQCRGPKYYDLAGSKQYERMLDRSYARLVRKRSRG